MNAYPSTEFALYPAVGFRTARRCILWLVLGWSLWLTWLPASAQTEPVRTISEAQFVLSDSPAPPPDNAAWQTRALPDFWGESKPGAPGYAWYRMNLDLAAAPRSPQAMYLPLMRTAGAVYVNGAQVGQGGSFERWEAERPQWFVVPAPLWHLGANRIEIRVWVAPGATGRLSPISVGDPETLRAQYDQRTFWRVTGSQLIFAVSLLIGLLMGLLWLQRRHDAIFGWFALTGFGFAMFVSPGIVPSGPLSLDQWHAFEGIGGWAVDIFTTMFVIRFAGWRWPRTERVLIGLFVVLSLGLLVDLAAGSHWFFNLLDYIWIPVVGFQVSCFFALAWRRPGVQEILLAVAAPWCFVDGLWESFFPYPAGWISWVDYSFLPHYAVMGWILIQRFAHSLNESEQLNAELEQRVQQKQAELQSNFQRLQQLERDQAIAEERGRIMSDMHDGIGAHLISTLGLAEHGTLSQPEMAASLRECLDDLRLTIDSLEPTDHDLLPALGNFRYQVDPRLHRQGITLEWLVQDLPKLGSLTPRNLLHVLRILQEAFANVLKHAHATMIRVETGLHDGGQQVFIRISDNGAGFKGEHRGRGLANMHERAQCIGGVLQVAPSASGTTLELFLPVA